MSEKLEVDAITSVTLRLTGQHGDGTGHHKIKVLGSRKQADLEQLGQVLLTIDGVIATKISLRRKWIEVMYNQNRPVEPALIFQRLLALNYENYDK